MSCLIISWHEKTQQKCTAILGAVRLMATLFFLSFLRDYYLQLDGKQKVIGSTVQLWLNCTNCTELHKLNTEAHDGHAVY